MKLKTLSLRKPLSSRQTRKVGHSGRTTKGVGKRAGVGGGVCVSVFKGKSRKASLRSQCLKNKLKGRRKGEQHTGGRCGGRAFQAEGTASGKVLRWEPAWCVQRTARRSVWPERSGQEGDQGRRRQAITKLSVGSGLNEMRSLEGNLIGLNGLCPAAC